MQPALWWEALSDAGIDAAAIVHRAYPADARLPWEHIGIRQGRIYLDRERDRSQAQFESRTVGQAARSV